MANSNNSEYLSNLRRALLESRVARQDAVMRRQYLANQINPQRELISNPILPNFNSPILNQETRNFTNNRVFQALPPPPSQPVVASRGSSSLFHYASGGFASQLGEPSRFPSETMLFGKNISIELAKFQAPPIRQEMEMKVSAADGTKPYINLLDKPVRNDEFVNRAIMYGGNPELPILDLELRL